MRNLEVPKPDQDRMVVPADPDSHDKVRLSDQGPPTTYMKSEPIGHEIGSSIPPTASCPLGHIPMDHATRRDIPAALALTRPRPEAPSPTGEELAMQARVAWRESVRCIGRLHWRSLRVIDARSLDDADSVFEACVEHLRLATNGGSITPVQTVFAPWRNNAPSIRIWNHQLIRYAGYRGADGTILGDPMNLEFTDLVRSLGWSPPPSPGSFDLLPLLIQAGDRLVLRELPRGVVLEVMLTHPEHRWFGNLGLRWHAVPAISDMMLVTNHEVYPCAPFNGWYMGTEIGARNLADEGRYNQLPRIADHMGIARNSRNPLWKDRALLALNEAVIHSFAQAGVRIVDHHQASREFLTFCERERKSGREVQAEWSWIVPPMSGSTTGVFHRLYPLQPRLPSLLPQVEGWKTTDGRMLMDRQAGASMA